MLHAMVINIHQSPFIGPIKIDQKMLQITPPWTMVVLKQNLLISMLLYRKTPVKW